MAKGSVRKESKEDDNEDGSGRKNSEGQRISTLSSLASEFFQTMEELLYTEEEWEDREKRRMEMSGCCVQEVWNIYNKIIDPMGTRKQLLDLKQEVDSSGMNDALQQATQIGPLCDINVQRRIRGLQRMYDRFFTALQLLKHAPSAPFIRVERPVIINETGARKYKVRAISSQKPEWKITDDIPTTIAFHHEIKDVSNENFISNMPIILKMQVGCQSKLDRDSSLIFTPIKQQYTAYPEERNKSDEQFDLTDYPLDKDGNPVGKSTGTCSYCNQEILPLPPSYLLSSGLEPSQFYCCKKYQLLMEETRAKEKQLRAAKQAKTAKLDISPHGAYNRKKANLIFGRNVKQVPFGKLKYGAMSKKQIERKMVEQRQKNLSKKLLAESRMSVRHRRTLGADDDEDDEEEEVKKSKKDKGKSQAQKAKNAAKLALKMKKRAEENMKNNRLEHQKEMSAKTKVIQMFDAKSDQSLQSDDDGGYYKNQSTSTDDLPWDPYEAFFGHPKLFNEDDFIDPKDKCYKHPLIVLTQSELYEMFIRMSVTRMMRNSLRQNKSQDQGEL